MELFVYDKNSDMHKISDTSWITLSKDLIEWSYNAQRAPNAEHYIYDIINGMYDQYFDFEKNIIDVGACNGVYSIELLKNNKFKHAYMFEPNKTYSYIIGINAVLNNVVNKIDVYNSLLSNTEDYIEFNGWVCNNQNIDVDRLTNTCYETDIRTEENDYTFKTIRSKTLDSYNLTNVGLIKIDVEGHEFQVLQGSLKTIIMNNYPPIIFEMWYPDNPNIIDYNLKKEQNDKLVYLLNVLGYEIIYEGNGGDTHLAIHK